MNFIIDMCFLPVFFKHWTLVEDTNRQNNWHIPSHSFPGVRFSLGGTTYQNNSIVTLEDIGDGDNTLLCLTDQTACCRPPYTDSTGLSALGNWFLPNGSRVPSNDLQWDFHRTRGQSAVFLHRRRRGVEGIYQCMIPDAMNVDQTVYIGVYSRTNTQAGE